MGAGGWGCWWLLIVWDKRSLALLDKEVGLFSISCSFKNINYGFVWVFTCVYGPLSRVEGFFFRMN